MKRISAGLPLARDAEALTNFKPDVVKEGKVAFAWVPMSIIRRAKRVAAAVIRSAPKRRAR